MTPRMGSHEAIWTGPHRPTQTATAAAASFHDWDPVAAASAAWAGMRRLLDVADVRVSLETLAAPQLAKHPGGEGMAHLRQALPVHLDALDPFDLVQADLTHLHQHRAIWEGADNKMLNRIWSLVESQFRMAMSLDQATRSDPRRDAELHVRLIEVIASGDQERITAEVREHIARSACDLVTLIECQTD